MQKKKRVKRNIFLPVRILESTWHRSWVAHAQFEGTSISPEELKQVSCRLKLVYLRCSFSNYEIKAYAAPSVSLFQVVKQEQIFLSQIHA